MNCVRVAAALAAGMASGASSLAALSADAVTQNAANTPAQLTRMYHKQRLPLNLDATRIAVRGDEAAVAKAGVTVGLAKLAPVQASLPGWWMIPLPAATAQADVEKLVGDLAAQPGVELVSPVFVDDLGGPAWVAGDLMIGFGADRAAADRDAVIAESKCGELRQRDYTLGVDRIVPASRNGLEILAAANALAQRDDVLFAEPDWAFSGVSHVIPNDTFFGNLWGIHNTGQAGGTADQDMDGPEAWDITTGNNAIIVTVIDNGADLTHPDLNLAPGADFTGSPGLAGAPGNACDNHGTPVAACISARFNNSLGVVGIAPACRSSSVRSFISTVPCNGTWSANGTWTVDALNFAQANSHRVTNNSNGYGFTLGAIDTAYQNTYNAGIVHFASNGNSGAGSIGYPANIPVVNGVCALQRNGNRAGFSQFGPGTDFSAPGQSIDACDWQGAAGYVNGDYVTVDGTSFASPYSAGVAALILSRDSSLTSAQVETVMRNTAVDRGPAGFDNEYGAGFVNAFAALLALAPANNACANAIDVSAGGVFNGTLVNATNDGTGSCGTSSTNPDVWYRYTNGGTCPVVLTVSTCGTNDTGGVNAGIDTVLAIFSTCGGTELGCNDDPASGDPCGATDDGNLRDSYLTTSVNAGQSVRIRVSKFSTSAVGPFVLRVSAAIANDACANAITVVASAPTAFCNVGANTDGPTEAACLFFSNNNVSQDLWYRYTPVGKGRFTVRTCGSSFDTKAAIYPNACPGATGTVLACADDSPECGGTGRQTSVSAIGVAGTPYLLRIGSFSTASGTGTVTVFCAADINFSGVASVQDIFDFLEFYFANNLAADINGVGGLTVQDIFDFLETYFSGC